MADRMTHESRCSRPRRGRACAGQLVPGVARQCEPAGDGRHKAGHDGGAGGHGGGAARRGAVLASWLLLSLAACVPGPPPPASQYRQAATVTRVPLVFVAGRAQLGVTQEAQLRNLAHDLPVQAVTALQTFGPLGPPRANEVASLLKRPVQLIGAPGMPPDEGLLTIESPPIVADACRGKGVRTLGSIWPSNDSVAPVLLPAGCATAIDIEAQTTEPGDLLFGRPLPPGAATPFAAAIERYYHRNDMPQGSPSGQQRGSQTGGGQGESEATPASGAWPLLGPLPSQVQGGQ